LDVLYLMFLLPRYAMDITKIRLQLWFNGRSMAVGLRLLRSQWVNTSANCYTSRADADLFIYFGCSAYSGNECHRMLLSWSNRRMRLRVVQRSNRRRIV